jgi:multimeric flavodoxin WrbA
MRKYASAAAAVLLLAAAGFAAASIASGGTRGGAGSTTTTTAAHKVTICHHTGSKRNPSVTITIDRSALPVHLRAGDTLGPCPPAKTQTTTTATTSTATTHTATTATTPAPKVAICHRTHSKTNPFVTIMVSENAVPAHLRHGDSRGACTNSTSHHGHGHH